MTRLNPAFTSLKTLNIPYQAALETLLSTPETLPTSEPATPQIGYTVQSSHLPQFSIGVYRPIYVAHLFGAGKCPTAATIYWRMKKNGASVKNGSFSVSANNFYTVQALFLNVAVGDVLELALWSSVSDSNWDYKAFQIQVTRLIPIKLRLLVPCNFASLGLQPYLTLGNPYVYTAGALTPTHADVNLPTTTSAKNYPAIYAGDTYGVFRINYGDLNNADNILNRTDASYRPYYYRNYCPTQIKFRGAKLD